MYTFTALVLALAGSTIAAPTIEERATSESFRLSVVGSEHLNGWAVVEAHVAAGTNAIEIQRPAAFQSELVKLSGTNKQVNNGKAKLQSRKPVFRQCIDVFRLSITTSLMRLSRQGSRLSLRIRPPQQCS